MPLSKDEIRERARARAVGAEVPKRATIRTRERERRKTITHRTASSPSVVTGIQRQDRQRADQEFRKSQFAATQQAKIDAERRRIARQDQLSRRRLYSGAVDDSLSSVQSTGSFGSTSTGQAIGSGSQSVSGGIFRVILVVVGLALLYLFVSNGGKGGTTILSGLNNVLSAITNPSALFAKKEAPATPSSLGAINTILNPLLPNPNAAQGPLPGKNAGQQLLGNSLPTP